MTEFIYDLPDGQLESALLAIIIKKEFHQPGISFLTPNDVAQQVGYINYPAGRKIAAHTHGPIPRNVNHTQEVLLLRKGRLRADIYNDRRVLIAQRVIEAGDVLVLLDGGHGFEVLEEVEMFEVKSGPYLGERDKIIYPRDLQ